MNLKKNKVKIFKLFFISKFISEEWFKNKNCWIQGFDWVYAEWLVEKINEFSGYDQWKWKDIRRSYLFEN